jgi:BirA family transcriptional regulator, biotin operon repressor / biotin---[acetyl-CoA-carboxylase] ligase
MQYFFNGVHTLSVSGTSDHLSEKAIRAGLSTHAFGRKILTLETVASTNEFAKSLNLDEGPHGTVVTAEEQISGRGRLGRQWESPRSENLLFTILLRPEEDQASKIPLIPFAAAVGAAEAIEAETGLVVECKWPNDLLIEKKKVCGMLLESSLLGAHFEKIVLGIGVNVNQKNFSAELLPYATSVAIEKGAGADRTALLRRMLSALEARYLQLMNEPPELLLNAWRKRTTMFGTRITVRESNFTFTGIAEALSADGSLMMRLDDGSAHTVRAGDVTLGYQQTFLHH